MVKVDSFAACISWLHMKKIDDAKISPFGPQFFFEGLRPVDPLEKETSSKSPDRFLVSTHVADYQIVGKNFQKSQNRGILYHSILPPELELFVEDLGTLATRIQPCQAKLVQLSQ